MKPLFHLPASASAIAAIFLLGVGLTRAQNDAETRRAAADGLLTAMHTEQTVNTTTSRMLTMVDRFGQTIARQGATLTPAQSEAIEKAEGDARDTISKEFGYAALKSDFVQVYADAFSEAELKDLTVFYNTPAGQKLVQTQPQLNEKMAQAAQKKMGTVMPGVIQKLREAAQKNVPPPVVATQAAPATAVTPPLPAAPTAPVPVVPATPGVPPAADTPAATSTLVPAVPTPVPAVTPAATPAVP